MIDKRYISRAQAVGAAASVHRIDTSQGLNYLSLAVAHSTNPGFGRAESKSANYSHAVVQPRQLRILEVRHAESHVETKAGAKGGRESESHALVKGYSLAEQLTADEVEAQLSSEHAPDQPLATIRPTGNRLVGLKLGGHALNVELDELLYQECPTKELLAKRFTGDPGLRKEYGWRFSADPGATEIPEYRGLYVCSLVRNLEWVKEPHPDVTIDGYVLRWKGFGRIYLGEMLIGDGSASLSMMRVAMGSPVDGDGSAGSVDQSSSTMP